MMIHPNQFRLFWGKRLDEQFRERRQQLHDTVERLPAKDLKDQTINENVQSIMSVLEVKPITFSLGSIEHQVVQEYITAEDHPKTKFFTDDPRWFGSERDVIVFRVPFQGNTELLWSTPTHFSGRRTDVYVEHPYLCFREIAWDSTEKELDDAKKRGLEIVDTIRSTVSAIEKETGEFNQSLREDTMILLERRMKEVQDRAGAIGKLGLNLKSAGPDPVTANHAIAAVNPPEADDRKPKREAVVARADEDGNPPTCFISYSHDSKTHKDWVRNFATELRNNGIESRLDQWDVHLGMDLPEYMETSIRESDYVLLVCTRQFAEKADKREGGVGYEKTIVTGEIYQGADPKKFVPVLRDGSLDISFPSYLKSKAYVDLRDEADAAVGVRKLVKHIHDEPDMIPPPIGPRPGSKNAEPEFDPGNKGKTSFEEG